MDFLAFDLGASGGRIHRGTFDGERLKLTPVTSFPNRMIRLGDGLYWDFTGIYQRLCEGIRQAAGEAPFDSLGIDSFNNDFSLIGPQGDLLMPIRAYRDPRTQKHEDAIYAMIDRRSLYGYTGNQLAPFNTFMQLAAMGLEGQGYLLENAHRLLFLPDLLGYYLTGQEYAEYTIASETQMMQWQTSAWNPELVGLLGLRPDLLAPIVPPGTIVGKANTQFLREYQVPAFSHVAVCEHDTASAFLAAPADAGSAILSCGTWTILGTENERPVITDYGFNHNIANEGSLPGHHRISYHVMGLWILQQLREDFLRQGQTLSYEDVQRLALKAPAFQHFIHPDDAVFYPPGGMAERVAHNALGSEAPLQPDDAGALFRCVYESLAMQYRWALNKIETLLERRFTSISLVGGGARDAVLCQFTANATGLPVMAGPFDASALGNVMVQMLAHGQIGSVPQGREVIRASFPIKEYVPKDWAIWKEQYARFLGLAHPGDGAEG